KTVQSATKNLPHEQAAARLHLADVARCLERAPAIPADRLVAELGAAIECQAVIRSGELPAIFQGQLLVISIEHEVARGMLPLLGVAGRATPGQDGLDIAVILDVERTLLHRAYVGAIIRVPFPAGRGSRAFGNDDRRLVH